METKDNSKILSHLDNEQKLVFEIISEGYKQEMDGGVEVIGTTLHFWGEFTHELAAQFQPNGPNGHQYLTFESLAEAQVAFKELRGSIFEKWPDTAEWNGTGWYKWMIHDMRQMTVKFENNQKEESAPKKKSWWKKK